MSLTHQLVPVACAILLWWLATGAIVYLDGLPRRTFKWTFAASTVLAGLAIGALVASRDWTEPLGAALAFAGAFFVWAWLEVSFYTGYVTGPRRARCLPGCGGWRHLGHAIGVSLYHELALLGALGIVWWIARDAANTVGLWTFAVLLAAHVSARLNVLLGVPHVTEVFLPEHLDHVRDFIGPPDARHALLPLSIAAFTALAIFLGIEAVAASTPFEATARAILAATAALAAAEHWALALPWRVERLWDWSVSSRAGR